MEDWTNKVIQGDCLEVMKDIPDKSIDMILTSPPYDNLREITKDILLTLKELPKKYIVY
jgi:DNA modification methylase